MLSKGSLGRDARSTQDAAAAAVSTTATSQKSCGPTQAPGDALFMPSSPPGGRNAAAGVTPVSVRGVNMRPKQATPFKGVSQSPSSAMLTPIASQTQVQTSLDLTVKSGKSVLRSNSSAPSPFSTDAVQTRVAKPSLDLTSTLGQGKLGVALISTGSLQASGLKGTFQPSSKAAAAVRMDSHREANSEAIPHFQGQALGSTLTPQPSQPVQTVQQMLAAIKQDASYRESSASAGGRLSPRDMSLGMPAVSDSTTSISEGRVRQAVLGGAVRDSKSLESPFADTLFSKSYANSISRRYAMAGKLLLLNSSQASGLCVI